MATYFLLVGVTYVLTYFNWPNYLFVISNAHFPPTERLIDRLTFYSLIFFVLGAWFSERSFFDVGKSQASVSQIPRFISLLFLCYSKVKLNTVHVLMVLVYIFYFISDRTGGGCPPTGYILKGKEVTIP